MRVPSLAAPRLILVLALALAAALALVLAGRWQAMREPRWVVEEVAVAGLARPISITFLTDLHGGPPDMPRRRIERIVDMANARGADLILLGGDYHGGKLFDRPMKLEHALEPLARLEAPLGVWAVTGNHDYSYWTGEVLRRHPWPVLLRNRAVHLGPLVLVGLDSLRLGFDSEAAAATLPDGAQAKPMLVLVHEPEAVQYLRGLEPDLVLAGHTHGGQILLGPLGSPMEWVAGRFVCRRGWCEVGGRRLFVSSGLGTSVVPLRLGVRPELVELRLIPAPGPAGRPATALGTAGSTPE